MILLSSRREKIYALEQIDFNLCLKLFKLYKNINILKTNEMSLDPGGIVNGAKVKI